MNLHPAEIAQEIRKYSFFQRFDESLLLQICTMLRAEFVAEEQVLLLQGQKNDHLYFLREGQVDVLVDGIKVNQIDQIGEVLGEMSVLSDSPVTATLIAKTGLKLFKLDANDFSYVPPAKQDYFRFLLHKVYSEVLTRRLAQTNEKAKRFEETAAQLEIAKKEIQIISQAQLQFLKPENSSAFAKVFLYEPQKKLQNIARSALGSVGVQLVISENLEDAKQKLTEPFDLLYIDIDYAQELSWFWSTGLVKQVVLFGSTDQINFQELNKLDFANNFIMRNMEYKTQNIKSILTGTLKLTKPQFLGMEKYLSVGCQMNLLELTKSAQRSDTIDLVKNELTKWGIRSARASSIATVLEEMLMNALIDAPTDRTTGAPLFNHLSRSQVFDLPQNDKIEVKYGFDGLTLGISITDPYGSLKKSTLLHYLESNFRGESGHTEGSGKGGAGRGLHQIICGADQTIFNVIPNKTTEVIALWNFDGTEGMHPQLQYFFQVP